MRTLQYAHYSFDFMVDGDGREEESVFRQATRMYKEREGEQLNPAFKYGEWPYMDQDGYFAIYAESDWVQNMAEAEVRQGVLFDKIAHSLGRLGVAMINRDYTLDGGDIYLVDRDEQRIGIVSGRSLSATTEEGAVACWGVRDFPEVDLT